MEAHPDNALALDGPCGGNKHSGKLFSVVHQEDVGYVQWAVGKLAEGGASGWVEGLAKYGLAVGVQSKQPRQQSQFHAQTPPTQWQPVAGAAEPPPPPKRARPLVMPEAAPPRSATAQGLVDMAEAGAAKLRGRETVRAYWAEQVQFAADYVQLQAHALEQVQRLEKDPSDELQGKLEAPDAAPADAKPWMKSNQFNCGNFSSNPDWSGKSFDDVYSNAPLKVWNWMLEKDSQCKWFGQFVDYARSRAADEGREIRPPAKPPQLGRR
jgi:hypothetical protein